MINTNSWIAVCVFSLFGLGFIPSSFAQDCNSCEPITVVCDPTTADKGTENGVMTQTFGTDPFGCQTNTLTCRDDADSGALSFMITLDEYYFFMSGDTLVCGPDGKWIAGTDIQLACEGFFDAASVSLPTCMITTTTSTTSTSTTTEATSTATETTPTTTEMTTTTTTAEPDTCCHEWSSWTSTAACGDTCGGCASSTFTRTCLTDDTCACVGESSKTEACNRQPCAAPRKSCCGSMTPKIVGNNIMCSAPGESVEPPPETCNCCPEQGIWSSWTEGACSDTCGGYGTGAKTRTCLSAAIGCPCIGESSETSKCKLKPCGVPRKSCADGLLIKVTVDGIVCAPSTSPITQTTCCSLEGLWNSWGSWTTCSTSCGGCSSANRTRTCASQPYGCPCTGSATEKSVCNIIACSTGAPCCVGTPQDVSGSSICASGATIETTTAVPAVWSEWTDGSCSDTCGLYGKKSQKRTCLSGVCSGESTRSTTTSCPTNPCPAGQGRPSCSSPASIRVSGSSIICAVA